jgi:hypothetical protein
MDPSKLSIALFEASCALGFLACGVVLGFCFGGLIGPRLLLHQAGAGLAQVGAMLHGTILGGVLGSSVAVAAFFKLPRARRQRLATSALALAALTALFTAVMVQRFDAW